MGIETIALIGGGLMGAAGSLYKGQAAKKAAYFNADVDAQRAAEERDNAAAETQDYIRKGSDTEASQVAAQGGTGVSSSSGSPLMVDANTVRQVALGAARTLQGGEVRANRLQDDAKLQRMQGRSAEIASYLDAGKSLLTAGGSAYGGGYGSRGRTP